MSRGRRFALSCDHSGCIVEILRDDFAAFSPAMIGKPVVSLVAVGSENRFFTLLGELLTETVVYGWQVEFDLNETRTEVHLAGAQDKGRMLLIATEDLEDVNQFNDELIKLNNHQVNHLREMIRDHPHRRPVADESMLDDLSAVGNELAAVHRRLAKQEMEMKRLLDERNTMMGMLVHDLRTPLTVVIGVSSLLLSDNLRSEHKELMQSILGAAENMTHLVNETMDWTQLKSATVELNLQPKDVNQLVDEVLAISRYLAARKNLSIRHESSHGVRPALIDGARIKQVLDNIIGNAIKFSPENGVITVAVSQSDEQIKIAVSDQGPGMEEELLGRVFEPFVHSAGAKSGGGYGLGLAIARRIVDLHDAAIDIESAPGKGTRVIIGLPAS